MVADGLSIINEDRSDLALESGSSQIDSGIQVKLNLGTGLDDA